MLVAAAAFRAGGHTIMKATTDINMSAAKRLWDTKRLFPSSSVFGYYDVVLYNLRRLYALRAGKFREAIYSIFLELRYRWYCVFRIRSGLIEFNPAPFWRCCSEYPLNLADLVATLRLHNFSMVESATRWFIITESADGVFFGVTDDRPHVLQRADNLVSTPTELFEFNKPIFCVFISSSNRIFVATKGVVYLSKNGGSHFDPVLQLSDEDSTVWHNHGIDETPQGLVIGEYANIINTGWTWDFYKQVAYLYVTHDDGESWRRFDYLIRTGAKHIHLIKYSRRLARLLVTDGDKRKQSYWLGLIDQMNPRDFKEARFDAFTRGRRPYCVRRDRKRDASRNRLPHCAQFDSLCALIGRQQRQDASSPVQAFACTKHVLHEVSCWENYVCISSRRSMSSVPKWFGLL
jgi:hypothetical protein